VSAHFRCAGKAARYTKPCLRQLGANRITGITGITGFSPSIQAYQMQQ